MPPLFPVALVPVSLDARDDAVLAAVRVLGLRGAIGRILVVHVLDVGRPWMGRAPVSPPRPEGLDRLVEGLAAALPGVEVRSRLGPGRVVDEVARATHEEGVDLLVLGRRADAAADPAWTLSGQRLLRLAEAPVLVVPDGAPLSFASAVVGMDFSDNAVAALRVARGIAPRVRVCAVVDVVAEAGTEDLHALTRDAWARIAGEGPAPELVLVDGASPAEALQGVPDADLLVVGSRGLTPLAAVLLGSTAEHLGAMCTRPLLVVRGKGEHRGLFQTLFRG